MTEAKKPSNKRIIDVKQPGRSTPDATSKAVIVSNRPILKDPMVVDEDKADDKPSSADQSKLKTNDKAKLQPLTAPTVEEPATDTNSDKDSTSSPESDEKVTGLIVPTEKIPEADDNVESKEKTTGKKSEPDDQLEAIIDKPASVDEKPGSEAKPEAETKSDVTDGSIDDKPVAPTAKELDAEAAEQAKHDAAVQKLVDSRQYFLPINSVEKRRTKRFVILGILLSLLLAIAWVDIALDAGIIQINSVKPVTHFFSN